MAGPVYEFGEFRLDSGHFELVRHGKSIRVERKPLELLILLASRQGQLVTRPEIAQRLWDSEVFVDTEHGINTAIRKIRQVLGDDSEEPRFVQTVTGKGYRILCPVEVSNGNTGVRDSLLIDDPADDPMPRLQPVEHRRRPKQLLSAIVFATVLVICLTFAFLYLRRPLSPPRITEYNQITHDGRPKRLDGTDGSRLYFYFSPASDNVQVSVSGGEITQMPSEVRDYNVFDISPDGTTFLLQGPGMSVWSDGVLGGSLRRMNGVFARSAAYSADGKSVAYATIDGDIYRMRSDGTEAQRLVSRRSVVPSTEWSPTPLTGLRTAVSCDFLISIRFGKYRQPDRTCIGCFPARLPLTRIASATGRPMESSSSTYPEPREGPHQIPSFKSGLWMSVGGHSGNHRVSRFS